ncbi:M48 family metalloprotease [Streptomyces sp. TLI_171]|uniref:M48 family metalloprotease n=1 Tax=Streptomyces sp. TLI_171 TaxID=1938859 RepID=UPI0016022F34|nr:M48 family metallopeptidase [Streptomyces sp. TLI_171]
MRTSTRALLAVALLVGFYLLAAAIVVGLVWLNVELVVNSDRFHAAMVKIWLLSAAIAYPVLRVVFLTRRPRSTGRDGLVLTRAEQPELWARVDRIAEATGVRGPAEIRLVSDVNAYVSEETRLLGLVRGPRHLAVGAPLLIGLSEAELDSVLAHEFGHYANNDVRLGAVTVAGRTALLHSIATLHHRADRHRAGRASEIAQDNAYRAARGRKARDEDPGNGGIERFLATLFTQYAKLYFRVTESVSRREEFAADRHAAEIAGRDATAAALRRIPVLGAAQGFYLNRYATMGWSAGLLPVRGQFYGGLAHLLADPERREELTAMGLELPEDEADPYDSHPPIRQRVAAIEALPDTDGLPGLGADRPAIGLLRDAERLLGDLETLDLVPEAAAKRRVEWPELVHQTLLVHAREEAQPILRALTDSGLHGTVESLLDALDAGRGEELAKRLPQSEESANATGRAAREFHRPLLRSALHSLTVLALVAQHAARWELSWSRPAALALPGDLAERLPAALDAAVATAPTPPRCAPCWPRPPPPRPPSPDASPPLENRPMARLIVIVPLVLLVGFKLTTWILERRTAKLKAATEAAEANVARIEEATRPTIVPTEHGLLPRTELALDAGPASPEIDAALDALKAGDRAPAAALLTAAGSDHDRRWGLVGRFAEPAVQDDAWLTAWRAEEPDSADAALLTLDALIGLAWEVRTSKLARDVTREQFQAFHRILHDAEEAAKEAVRLADPADPLPFVAQIPLAMGLSWEHERFDGLWAEIVARDPHNYSAHGRALQYWCAKWKGSHERMHAFADAAIAAAPAGSLLTVLKLEAFYEQFARDRAKRSAWQAPEVRAAADAVLADLAAADPADRRIPEVRGWLAYALVRAERPAEAVEQFRALGPVVPSPWATYFNDPVEAFTGERARAVLDAS